MKTKVTLIEEIARTRPSGTANKNVVFLGLFYGSREIHRRTKSTRVGRKWRLHVSLAVYSPRLALWSCTGWESFTPVRTADWQPGYSLASLCFPRGLYVAEHARGVETLTDNPCLDYPTPTDSYPDAVTPHTTNPLEYVEQTYLTLSPH